MRTASLLLAMVGLFACQGGGATNEVAAGEEDESNKNSGPSALSVDATDVEFGEINVGEISTATVKITNTGGKKFQIVQVSITDTQFSTTTAGGQELLPGVTSTMSLTYTPTGYGEHSAVLSIQTDAKKDPTAELTLSGSVIADADGDGFDSVDAGGLDCDDDNDQVNPDAWDEWYDGEDSNCDGADDYDQDGDGFQTDEHNPDAEDGGGDCQDANPDMFPGAVDEWYDGEDTNCDGVSDWDQDGDGEDAAAHGQGEDCDDTNPDVNFKNGVEKLNGADDDCDGGFDVKVPGWSADLTYTGTASGDRAGYSLSMGDLDGNGTDELIIGTRDAQSGYGEVSIFSSDALPSDGSNIEQGENWFRGASSTDRLGGSVLFLDDYTGDGDGDLAVGAPGASGGSGTLYVLKGTDALLGDTDDATVTVTGSGSYLVGTGLASNLDLDGDGTSDLYGYMSSSTSISGTGQTWLLYGGQSGDFTTSTVDATFTTSNGTKGNAARNFPRAGDLNGDGYDDAVYCDSFADNGQTNDGVVWVLWGQATQYTNSGTDLDSAGTVAVEGGTYMRLGWACSVIPDQDGDGNDELVVAGPAQTEDLWVFAGGDDLVNGGLTSDDAWTTYELGSSDPNVQVIRVLGDMTGDGVAEWMVGTEPDSNDPGSIFIYSSEVYGDNTLDAGKDALGYAEADEDDPYWQSTYGASLSNTPGDLDGDGKDDLVVGDSGWGNTDLSEQNTGQILVTFNRATW